MKNKKIIRKFTVLLAALVIMCGFSVTAYAGGGDESDDTPTPVTEETPAPETEPEETTGGYEPQPLTPDGNMSLVDDITGEASGDKQFITVVTKSGNYFYIIIDRAEDGDEMGNIIFRYQCIKQDIGLTGNSRSPPYFHIRHFDLPFFGNTITGNNNLIHFFCIFFHLHLQFVSRLNQNMLRFHPDKRKGK